MSKVQFIKKNNLNDSKTLKYNIETIEKDGSEVVIKGWVYSISRLFVNTELVDSNKEKSFESKIWRKSRRDIRDFFELEDDNKAEFSIRFERDAVSDECIFIHFYTSDVDGMYVEINMQGFDFSLTSWGKTIDFISDAPVRKSAKFIKNTPKRILDRINAKKNKGKDLYALWRNENQLSFLDYENQRRKRFKYNPVISISIPLYNTPIEFFKPLMDSIVNQTYSNYQLCLADGSDGDYLQKYIENHYQSDDRMKYCKLDDNYGISGNTNKALEMATGDYVMLVDHDDLLEINALYEIVKVLNDNPNIDIIYTDEDLVDESGTFFSDYKFKPDFNLEMLRHRNYICHIFAVRKSILDVVGGFREEYDGAQDFDMILRCVEKTDKIYHIPKVLYHWRAHEDSTAGNADSKRYAVEASVKALEDHYSRMGIDADVEATDVFIMLKTTRKLKCEPLVSILIPNMDHVEDLDKCIRSIIKKTIYKNYEIIIIENNSADKDTFSYYDNICEEYDCVRVYKWEYEFNFSKINNYGAKYANGEYYILLNNDIEVISPDWITRMVAYCQDENVGAVGAKLLYPDGTIQHCGVVIGVGGFAGHIMNGMDVDDVGYFGRLKVQQEVSAVTAACMMVDAKVFGEIGGFDDSFAVALNDVDLCLKIRKHGKKIILDPNITMYHYESKSRGYEESSEKKARFKGEIKHFRDKWKRFLEIGDPYYSPNLALDRMDCMPRRKNEVFTVIEEIERREI